jgi:proteasome accessory factor A
MPSASGPTTSGRACRRRRPGRPIINTRDEPHADAEQYRRLHVIVGDSNMSETTTMLKVGSADLVLRMLEAGVVPA